MDSPPTTGSAPILLSSPCQCKHSEPLPKFDGEDPEVWITLATVYERLRSNGRNEDDLFTDIAEAVSGEARKIIASDLLVRSETEVIMRKLRRFYGDKDVVLSRLLSAIELSPPPRESPRSKLKDFALKLDGLVTVANAFGVPEYLR